MACSSGKMLPYSTNNINYITQQNIALLICQRVLDKSQARSHLTRLALPTCSYFFNSLKKTTLNTLWQKEILLIMVFSWDSSYTLTCLVKWGASNSMAFSKACRAAFLTLTLSSLALLRNMENNPSLSDKSKKNGKCLNAFPNADAFSSLYSKWLLWQMEKLLPQCFQIYSIMFLSFRDFPWFLSCMLPIYWIWERV